jgi:hypothetical protein
MNHLPIFLSAQPDDYFFTWQLELQLFNFHKMGISPGKIHVLIGYHPDRGLRHYFTELIERNKGKAVFFTYPDRRLKPKYASSLRPHIIQQHYAANPWLSDEPIFYHDSDIIFRKLPDLDRLLKDDTWYVSDTRAYLDSGYVKATSCQRTFSKMCALVGVEPEKVELNDDNCGGAQYILKGIDPFFWAKIERDSESIYALLNETNLHKGDKFLQEGKRFSAYYGIQSWCADMWAMFYNGLYFGKNIRLAKGMEFCWATDKIAEWEDKNILHYTGAVALKGKEFFRKSNFIHYPPYHDDCLKSISQQTASYPLVELIRDFNEQEEEKRIDLQDVSFLIPVRIDSPSRLENLLINIRCLEKYFKTNILIIESDSASHVPLEDLPPSCDYLFVQDDNPFLHRTRINNMLVRRASTPLVALHDVDAIAPVSQITDTVEILRNHAADLVSPYDGRFTSVDNLFKALFGKILDPDLLVLNQNKLETTIDRSWGGSVFMLKRSFLRAGLDNEHFKSWGPDDQERIKRMKTLGYVVKRVPGPLFHLPHERKENSYFSDTGTHIKYTEEYLHVCNLRSDALRQYVSTWEWINK